MRVMNTGLHATLCVPGKDAPKSMKIIARVFDGKESVEYTFGPHVPLKSIWEQIPRLYMDSKFPPAKKIKSIAKGDVIIVKSKGKTVDAIVLADGSIIVNEKEAV
jgi:hypothetical protein